MFRHLTDSIVELEPEVAELAKLFTNTWRYIKVAAANEYYVMANDHNLDYDVIRKGTRPGLAARPGHAAGGVRHRTCLFGDTMQLAASTDDSFVLGHSAMLTNEGLPLYLVSRLEKKYRLEKLTVGILGMAFKGESDDIRSSLSRKLKRILQFRAAEVLCTDPSSPSTTAFGRWGRSWSARTFSIIGDPHRQHQHLGVGRGRRLVWSLLEKGTTA